MFCSKCGTAVAEGASFCSACGQPLGGPQPVAAVPPFIGTAPTAPIPAPQVAAGQPAPAPWPVAAPPPQRIYAGFWLRFVAFIIDSLILGIPLSVLIGLGAAVFGLSAAIGSLHPDEAPQALLGILGLGFVFAVLGVFLVGGWLYYAWTESSSWQATLGKKTLGLYVTDLGGQRISFARATGRFFGKILSGHFTIYIGYIMAGFTEKKQALHDMIAGCLVLRKL